MGEVCEVHNQRNQNNGVTNNEMQHIDSVLKHNDVVSNKIVYNVERNLSFIRIY